MWLPSKGEEQWCSGRVMESLDGTRPNRANEPAEGIKGEREGTRIRDAPTKGNGRAWGLTGECSRRHDNGVVDEKKGQKNYRQGESSAESREFPENNTYASGGGKRRLGSDK